MITITKEEAMAVREKFKDGALITITGKTKHGGRKKYYMSEESRLVGYVNALRKKSSVKSKYGGKNIER